MWEASTLPRYLPSEFYYDWLFAVFFVLLFLEIWGNPGAPPACLDHPGQWFDAGIWEHSVTQTLGAGDTPGHPNGAGSFQGCI